MSVVKAMQGSWVFQLGEEESAKLAGVQELLDAAPEDSDLQEMAGMFQAMASMTLQISADTLDMNIGGESNPGKFTVKSDTADQAVLDTRTPDGNQEQIRVAFDGDALVLTRGEGEYAQQMRFSRG